MCNAPVHTSHTAWSLFHRYSFTLMFLTLNLSLLHLSCPTEQLWHVFKPKTNHWTHKSSQPKSILTLTLTSVDGWKGNSSQSPISFNLCSNVTTSFKSYINCPILVLKISRWQSDKYLSRASFYLKMISVYLSVVSNLLHLKLHEYLWTNSYLHNCNSLLRPSGGAVARAALVLRRHEG